MTTLLVEAVPAAIAMLYVEIVAVTLLKDGSGLQVAQQ